VAGPVSRFRVPGDAPGRLDGHRARLPPLRPGVAAEQVHQHQAHGLRRVSALSPALARTERLPARLLRGGVRVPRAYRLAGELVELPLTGAVGGPRAPEPPQLRWAPLFRAVRPRLHEGRGTGRTVGGPVWGETSVEVRATEPWSGRYRSPLPPRPPRPSRGLPLRKGRRGGGGKRKERIARKIVFPPRRLRARVAPVLHPRVRDLRAGHRHARPRV
ncbi:MAG: hypothetical protein AVDCRST_MAG22-3387, partial [uncultured Rubrobacteraceae bacterium]